jgi:hypothetical protein
MPTSGLDDRIRADGPGSPIRCEWKRSRSRLSAACAAALLTFLAVVSEIRAEPADWELPALEAEYDSGVSRFTPSRFAAAPPAARGSGIKFLPRQTAVHDESSVTDSAVAPAEFAQPADDSIPLPEYLKTTQPANPQERLPQPAFLDPQNPQSPIADQLDQLKRRLEQLETTRVAQEDATRAIIRKSFAERGSNITDSVIFGGTLETLTFWQDDFDGVTESDIVLDTVELDFEIEMNKWSRASLVMDYFDGRDFLFATNEGDAVGVDRFTVRRGIITLGNTTRYPLFITTGRDTVPFGISTGDPVTDVLTIVDPLTVEVFETQEDFVMFGFEMPVPPPPPPVSPYSAPAPAPPRPILFNPLARTVVRSVCPYCGPWDKPLTPVATPPTCFAPYSGAIYFYNGNSLEGVNDSNNIKQMGGTLGYRTKGNFGNRCLPWTLDCDVDVNSSVFDSNFLQFEYRHFLDQIGFVPGMAAHIKSSVGPVGIVLEWNGAISQARFTDDAGNPVAITPTAWQVAVNYQFDWNPSVESIGAQGTYLAMGYSESTDLGGVTRIVDPVAPVPERVGFVPERRFSIGIGEWILDGMRVAFEYSHAIDYGVNEGGTGNSADAVLMQWTYEW